MASGVSVLPPAPVHLRWSDDGVGGAAVTWVRRSRAGWRWIDGVDAPLVEEREAYRVTVSTAIGSRTAVCEQPVATITEAERATGATIAVRQIGAFGESPPGALTVE